MAKNYSEKFGNNDESDNPFMFIIHIIENALVLTSSSVMSQPFPININYNLPQLQIPIGPESDENSKCIKITMMFNTVTIISTSIIPLIAKVASHVVRKMVTFQDKVFIPISLSGIISQDASDIISQLAFPLWFISFSTFYDY